MVPLISTLAELKNQESLICRTAEKVFDEMGTKVDYNIGTMIKITKCVSSQSTNRDPKQVLNRFVELPQAFESRGNPKGR